MSSMANVIGQLDARRREVRRELDGINNAIASLVVRTGNSRVVRLD